MKRLGKEYIKHVETHELRAELLEMVAAGANAATEVARRAPIAKENFIVENVTCIVLEQMEQTPKPC